MTLSKKFFIKPSAWAVTLAAVLICVCSKAPEYCGDKALDTDKEFCFGGITYAKCGGAEYSPDAEFCYAKKIYAKCEGHEYDPGSQSCERGVLTASCGEAKYLQMTQFCYAYVVYDRCDTAAYNPATQFCAKNAVYAKCGGQYAYDPAIQTCDNGTVKAQCGIEYYNPAGQFCANNIIYPKCGGQYVYDPATQTCENNAVKARCGNGDYYNPALQFCHNNEIYDKCADTTYDPINQRCQNNIVQAKCGNEYYSTAAQFCVLGIIYPKCAGKEYDPSGFKCDNNVLKTKCGNDSYYNPATEFCSNGTVMATCGGKTYDPAKQKCNGTTLVNITTVTVAFNANGATGTTPTSIVAEAGDSVTLPLKGALTREGYSFGGWNANAAGTGTSYAAGAKFKVTGSAGSTVTLYAKWLRSFTVTFNANGGDGTIPAMTADSGTTINLPDQTALGRTGYNVGGWNTMATGGGENYTAGTSYRVSGNVTLYANWIGIKYKLTINVSPTTGGGSVVRNPSGTEYIAGTTVTLTATPSSGYGFKGWSGAGGFTSTANPLTVEMNEDKTVTATFEKGYSLTTDVYPVGGGRVTRSSDASIFGEDAFITVTVTAVANDGYVFTGWNGGAITSTQSLYKDVSLDVMMNNNKTVMATFAKIVKIGEQTWMGNNLNYEIASGSWCYDSCSKYGRQYNWSTAKLACPSGWHLPSAEEWDTLIDYAGGKDVAGLKLKAKSGWNKRSDGGNGNGTDDYGFSALPNAGEYKSGWWWTATAVNNYYASMVTMFFEGDDVHVEHTRFSRDQASYVRCLKDD